MADDDISVEGTRAELRASLDVLGRTVEEYEDLVARAKAAVQEARDQVHWRINRYALAIQWAETVPPDREMAREIYWEYPQVNVGPLAALLHVPAGSVFAAVGPYDVEKPCRGGCGRVLRVTRTSRAGAGSQRRDLYCEECAATREEELRRRHAESARMWEAEDAERIRLIEEAQAAGVKPSAVYVEYPGVGGTWRVSNAELEGDIDLSPPYS